MASRVSWRLLIIVNLDERCHRNDILWLQGVGGGVVIGDDNVVPQVTSGNRVPDKPIIPSVTTHDVVEPIREQLVVRVKMVEHEGHVVLESCGDDDMDNDVEEDNTTYSGV
jgi:hypothetical protein